MYSNFPFSIGIVNSLYGHAGLAYFIARYDSREFKKARSCYDGIEVHMRPMRRSILKQ